MQASSFSFLSTQNPIRAKFCPWRYDSRNLEGRLRISASSQSDEGDNSNYSSLSRRQSYVLLKQQLAVAAKAEDYKEVARLRDSLKLFEEKEPILRLQRMIKEAVEDERFEDAARYKDELLLLSPSALLRCSSDATTLSRGAKCLYRREKSAIERPLSFRISYKNHKQLNPSLSASEKTLDCS